MNATSSHLQQLLASLPQPVLAHIQHLERMRQDFVANVSHELRTPLTVIQGYLECLLDTSSASQEEQAIYQHMQQQVLHMGVLVEDLLLLSRLEDHYTPVHDHKQIDVPKLLNILIQEAHCLSGANQHRITHRICRQLFLKGIEGEIRSLFSNLIFNAVKYTPEKGQIKIAWYPTQQGACFKVEDNGIGIAEKHIPRLTERFYRVDKARSRSSGGTGLGLAIAKHVLIRHDAQLKIKSQLKNGSCFQCIFPEKRIRLKKTLCKKTGKSY